MLMRLAKNASASYHLMQLFASLFRVKRRVECFSLLQAEIFIFSTKCWPTNANFNSSRFARNFARFWWRNSEATWQQIGSHISSFNSKCYSDECLLTLNSERAFLFFVGWSRNDAAWISSDSLVSQAFQFIFFPSLAHQPQSEFSTRSFSALAFAKIVGRGSCWILRRGAVISIESWEKFLRPSWRLEFPSIISPSCSLVLHDPLRQLNDDQRLITHENVVKTPKSSDSFSVSNSDAIYLSVDVQ